MTLSDDRNGCFLDSMGACKVCDGEIPYGHTSNCDIWKLEQEVIALKAAANKVCQYTQFESGSNHYQTGCDHYFTLGIGLDLFPFCHWCGHKVEAVSR